MTGTPWTEAVGKLWPGARVETLRRDSAGANGSAAPVRREFVFLPDARRPRLLLPAGLPGAAASALRRYSHDLGLARRVSRSLAATAVRTGLPERALRDRLRVVGGDAASVEDRLGELLGRRVVVTVGLGTARANRKPVLQVLTPAGAPIAFVKVGDTSTARALTDGEAAALRTLAGLPLPGISVPRVLHHGGWGELTLLVLSALPTSARGWRPRRRPPVAAMRTLAAAAGQHRGSLVGSPYWKRITQVPARITEPAAAERLAGVLDRIAAECGDAEFDFGAWHGDWTPWNMAWHNGSVQLWDWERFDIGVPYGLDLLHYRLQEADQQASPSPYERIPADAADLLAPLGIRGPLGAATVRLYYLELCVRYLLAAQEPIGGPLRERAGRLLGMLDHQAGRTG